MFWWNQAHLWKRHKAQISTLPLPRCVTLEKPFNLSGPLSPNLRNGGNGADALSSLSVFTSWVTRGRKDPRVQDSELQVCLTASEWQVTTGVRQEAHEDEFVFLKDGLGMYWFSFTDFLGERFFIVICVFPLQSYICRWVMLFILVWHLREQVFILVFMFNPFSEEIWNDLNIKQSIKTINPE